MRKKQPKPKYSKTVLKRAKALKLVDMAAAVAHDDYNHDAGDGHTLRCYVRMGKTPTSYVHDVCPSDDESFQTTVHDFGHIPVIPWHGWDFGRQDIPHSTLLDHFDLAELSAYADYAAGILCLPAAMQTLEVT